MCCPDISISVLGRPIAVGGIWAELVNTLPTYEYAVPTSPPDLVEVDAIHHTSLPAWAEPKYATGRKRYSQGRIPQIHGHAAI